MKSVTYFISDAHLGIRIRGHDDRQARLFSFLDSIAPDAEALYIVGDLFDFWIEYKHAIRPEYFPVAAKLYGLVAAGTRVHYLAGNHDFALGPFLSDIMGILIHHDHLETEIQGKKVHLFHGDGLLKADVGYRILRRILRNRVNQRLYRLLHPGIGVPLALFFSGSSRSLLADWLTPEKLEEYRQHAKRYLQTNDIVIFGHTHKPEIRRYDGKVYVNIGEWMRRYTYARMEKGEIKLFEWFEDKPAEEIKQ